MAGDINKVDTGRLIDAAAGVEKAKKGIVGAVDSVNAVFRKMLESNEGDAADELSAVTKQLKSSSSDIIKTLSSYETVLKELAGIYEEAEIKTVSSASKLKFGGLR
ncbi:MAG: WXG100 family type VII secretion target [Lachnospiraceae bacterium]|nr:WXG100 family type VII secretion target [Lachnospiraceae bacterium]